MSLVRLDQCAYVLSPPPGYVKPIADHIGPEFETDVNDLSGVDAVSGAEAVSGVEAVSGDDEVSGPVAAFGDVDVFGELDVGIDDGMIGMIGMNDVGDISAEGARKRKQYLRIRKPTAIITNMKFAEQFLARTCNGEHTHVHAIGSVKVVRRWQKIATAAGRYPDAPCRCLVRLLLRNLDH